MTESGHRSVDGHHGVTGRLCPTENGRDATCGRFISGNRGGPGRTPGGAGRQRALAIIDDLLADAGNQATLRRAFQTEFDRDPLRFFMDVVMPLLPRDVNLGASAAESYRVYVNIDVDSV